MGQNSVPSDWAGERGEKWRARLPEMEAMLAPINQPLIDALHLDSPYRIADVGCGGGGTTLEILRRSPAGSVVHGFDLSPALIEAARARKPPDDRDRAIAFEVADMATAAAPCERYDRMASRFGIMFFDDPGAAFSNLARWLAPGGRFAFAAWGPFEENLWMSRVRDVVAKVIDVPKADPEAPGAFRYAEAGKLLAVLDQAGFGERAVSDWRGELAIGGGLPAAEAASFALSSFSSFGELLAEAGDQAKNEAHQSLTALFSRNNSGGPIRMGACVHIFTGVRHP